jgi:hypothetical protein
MIKLLEELPIGLTIRRSISFDVRLTAVFWPFGSPLIFVLFRFAQTQLLSATDKIIVAEKGCYGMQSQLKD